MSSGNVADVVAVAWSDLLGVDQARPEDDFFALGGDSMLALELVKRVEQQTGITFPLEALFQFGTFGEVVQACEQEAAKLGSNQASP